MSTGAPTSSISSTADRGDVCGYFEFAAEAMVLQSESLDAGACQVEVFVELLVVAAQFVVVAFEFPEPVCRAWIVS
jgi:hypothetical protein